MGPACRGGHLAPPEVSERRSGIGVEVEGGRGRNAGSQTLDSGSASPEEPLTSEETWAGAKPPVRALSGRRPDMPAAVEYPLWPR